MDTKREFVGPQRKAQAATLGGAAKAIFALMALFTLLWGCTAQQGFVTAETWQRNQCNAYPDKADYDRCMSQTTEGYEAYQREVERNPQ